MAFSINFEDDILIKISGITVAIHDVVVEFDSKGCVESIEADGQALSLYSSDPVIRLMFAEICTALDSDSNQSWIEDVRAAWLADEPNREADHRRSRSA